MKPQIMRAAFFAKVGRGWGIPLMALGEPGIGKTSLQEQFAEQWSVGYQCLSPGEMGEGAFGVTPYPISIDEALKRANNDGEMLVPNPNAVDIVPHVTEEGVRRKVRPGWENAVVLTYPRPEWTLQCDFNPRGLVNVDELTTASAYLQAPLLGLTIRGRVAGYQLPPGWRVMATGNRRDQVHGHEPSLALKNRLMLIQWRKPTIAQHRAYMLNRAQCTTVTEYLDAEEEEDRVESLWPREFAKAAGQEVAFLKTRPNLKNNCPSGQDESATSESWSWPSDRSWELATIALTSARIQRLDQVDTEEMVSGCIGAGPAGEWFSWMENQDLPDPFQMLDGKLTQTDDGPLVTYADEKGNRMTWQHEPSRPDVTHAVFASCVAAVSPTNADCRTPRATLFWEMLNTLRRNKDLVIGPAKDLCEAQLQTIPASHKALAKMRPMLEKAGIL